MKSKSVLMGCLFWLAALVLAGIFLTASLHGKKRALAAAFEEGRKEGARYAIGYPAIAAELEDNATYLVNALSSEIETNRTNYFAELRLVMRGADTHIRNSTTNRLFALSWKVAAILGTNHYYRAFADPIGGGTNMDFIEVPPPTSSPR